MKDAKQVDYFRRNRWNYATDNAAGDKKQQK